ncbi:hypothetical protein CTI12_AA065640 [Artemisia annua]|nr:hypothetical protein CTI12_AA065640 [Artemisia annua]
MLGNNDQFPRVGRYLPDECESTLDSKHTSMTRRRRRHSTSDILDSRLRSSQRTTRLPLNQSMSQDDQVVPQIGKTRNKEEAERDGQRFAMTTTASST